MALQAKNLSVIRGGRHLVRDVDITLLGNELVGLIGPNGAGKSTLLAAMLPSVI